jgi:uncharacterized protein YjbI with pentapeptide repeats
VAAGVLATLSGLVVIGYVALKLTPERFGSDQLPDTTCGRPSDKAFKNCLDAAKARADDRRAVSTATLAILAGGIATVGAVLTGLSYRLNRAGQITERFTRAIDQLGSAELDVRLGGIYALERLARDSRDDHPQVVEVLTAYVREHAPWPPKTVRATDGEQRSEALVALTEAIQALERIAKGGVPEDAPTRPDYSDPPPSAPGTDEPPPIPTDIQAVLSVLGRRLTSHDRTDASLDLSGTDLRRLVLAGDEAHLERANLAGAHLERANLAGAYLEQAFLGGAHLEGAHLGGAHLEGAHLGDAHLEEASLGDAHLEEADLAWAHLEWAFLGGAHLERAGLAGAHLERANLGEAHLEKAHLGEAHLEGASLAGAHLEGAELKRVVYDDATTWPEGFDYRAAGALHVDETSAECEWTVE